jgi:serine phosphatase RsbU (regulator of sigma subunit)
LRKGGWIEKTKEFNLAIGLGENTAYESRSLILEPGDRVFLFTDGFGDAVNNEGLRYGDDRVERVVASLRTAEPEALIRELVASVDEFSGEVPQFDDLTCLLATFIERKV